ncbi:Fcf2 pre-rRNA processing-domain-containing protein [Phycomyces nitens]|nr:Fcf2 pre-rRNA processing-domain-containing protein [Phycomyces nitens]
MPITRLQRQKMADNHEEPIEKDTHQKAKRPISAIQAKKQRAMETKAAAEKAVAEKAAMEAAQKTKKEEQIAAKVAVASKESDNEPEESDSEQSDSEESDSEESDSEESDSEESEDEDLDILLNKAKTALEAQKLQEENEESEEAVIKRLNLSRLDAGVSVKDSLYITQEHRRAHLNKASVSLVDATDADKTDKEKEALVVLKSNKPEEAQLTKRERQKLREKTTGKGWFDMERPEITEEIKRDLQIIKMRHVLDRKRHYKKMGKNYNPKFFQVGTIIEGPTEFFSSRILKKDRKQTLVDELLADEQSKQYFKRKFDETQERTNNGGKKHFKKLKQKRKWTK